MTSLPFSPSSNPGASSSPAKKSQNPSLDHAIQKSDVVELAELFRSWRRNKSLNVEHVIDLIARQILGFSGTELNIVNKAGKLAAEPNDSPFHGNRHSLEVFAMTALLGRHALHNGPFEKRISKRSLANLLTAALIQGYKHDGGTNGGVQFRLEELAYESAAPALQEAGAMVSDLKFIRAYVLANDTSKDCDDTRDWWTKFKNPKAVVSPAESVMTFLHTERAADLHPKLNALKNLTQADIAMMLYDANLAITISNNGLAAKQGGALNAQNRGMASKSGQELLQLHLDGTMIGFVPQPPANGLTT